MEQKPKKEAWVISGLVDRLEELIRAGALLKELKDDTEFRKLYARIKKEFAEELPRHIFNLEMFREKVLELVWSKDNRNHIAKAVGYGWKFEKFQRAHTYIPEWMYDRERKKLVGKNVPARSLPFVPGVGRIATSEVLAALEEVELPEGSFENPVMIPVQDPDNPKLFPINAPSVGARYNRVLTENLLYNAIGEANRTRQDVLLIPGGIFSFDTKRSGQGNLRTQSARLSGIDFDSEVVDPDYVEEAQRIHDEQPSDEIRCETVAEKIQNLFKGYSKVFHRKDGSPRLHEHCTVVVQLGYKAEEILGQAVEAELNYWIRLRREETEAEREMLLDAQGGVETPDSIALLKKIQRLRITNAADEERRRFFGKMLAFFVRSLERAIPNCVVIGLGTRYLEMGNDLIEVYQPRRETATENNLADYVVKKAVRRTLEGNVPDLALVAGPHNINASWAVVEHADKDHRRASMDVWQLPMTVDRDFIRKASRDFIRTTRPMEKALFHHDFEPGIVSFQRISGIWVADLYTVNAIHSYRDRRANGDPKYIWTFIDTDPHFGHAWKARVFVPDQQSWLGLGPAVFHMMRQGGLFEEGQERLHAFHEEDDATQGHNFATEYQIHENVMPHHLMEVYFNRLHDEALRSQDPETALHVLEEIKEAGLKQDRLRGETWPQRQMDQFVDEMIRPNADAFAAIVRRAEAADVRFRGVGTILGEVFDTRNICAICLGSGNHRARTDDGATFEGDYFVDALTLLLAGDPRAGGKSSEELEAFIAAPKYGNDHFAAGLVSVGEDGYEWGLQLRAQPAKKGGQGDPIRKDAQNFREMGNFTLIFEDRHVIAESGDIHRFGCVCMPGLTRFSCGSGTHNDPYGLRGFSLNNTGNMVYGIPVDGPDSGPIRVITFRYDFIRNYFEDPYEIDWDALMPNPA